MVGWHVSMCLHVEDYAPLMPFDSEFTFHVLVEGIEPSSRRLKGVCAAVALHQLECARWESNPQTTRFELVRFTNYLHLHKVHTMGVEPILVTLSTLCLCQVGLDVYVLFLDSTSPPIICQCMTIWTQKTDIRLFVASISVYSMQFKRYR